MMVASLARPKSFPGVLAETGINSAADLPWRVMVTRDFSFCTLAVTPRRVALNWVTAISIRSKPVTSFAI